MKKRKNRDFNFARARKVTSEETEAFRVAIEKTLGVHRPKRGRPEKDPSEKFTPISIRLHPTALAWAKKEALRHGVGYQTIINDLLMKKATKRKAS
jgi:uncharacterized protein (DUF4415 family)